MQLTTRILAAFAAATIIGGAAHAAQNVTGAWKGKLKLNLAKIPGIDKMQPQQREMLKQRAAQTAAMTIHLNLKADHTYTVTLTGLPAAVDKKQGTDNGTWSLKGRTLTTKSAKNKGEKPQTMALSADGRRLSMTPPGATADSVLVVFTR